MKRALTGIAAAAVVLGTAAPMAFAATSTGLTKAGTLPIVVNGSVLSNPYEMTGKDSGNTTAYFPVYYFDQALTKAGFTVTWDGVTHTWAITANGVDASKISVPGGVGTGNTSITVNGTVVKKINTKAAKDPAASKSAAPTTYLPVFYIDEILKALGVNGSFSGQTGLNITTPLTGAAFSAFSVSGNQEGTGTQASPAVSTNGGALSLSTTLTSSENAPLANTSVSLSIAGSTQPVVSVNGSYITTTEDADGNYDATVTTDANGKLNLSVVGTGSYTVTVSDGSSVKTSGYLAFLGSNGLVTVAAKPNISTISNATAGVTPVTFTLPLDSSGNVQKDTQVTFTVSPVSPATSDGADFTTAAGQSIGKSVSVYSDANGQATVYLNDFTAESVSVSAYVTASGSGAATSTTVAYQDPNATTTTATLNNIGAFAFPTLVTGANDTSANSVTGVPSANEAYFAPVGSDKKPLTGDNADATYTLSANDGYYINGVSIDKSAAGDFGTSLTIPPALGKASNLTLTVKYDDTNKVYDYYINGVEVSTSGINSNFAVSLAAGSSTTGTTPTLSVTSGSVSATAGFSFGGATPVNVSGFSPVIVTGMSAPGSTDTVSFTVDDGNGKAVANQAVKITLPTAAGEWITAVNGKQLSEPLGTSGASVYTPISLGTSVGYDVGLPNLANWNHSTPGTLTVYTDANGKVSLTFQNGDVWYDNSGVNAEDTTVASNNLYAYTPNIAAKEGVLDFVYGTSATAPTFNQVSGTTAPTATQVGEIDG